MDYTEIFNWLYNLVFILIPLCVIMLIVFIVDTVTGVLKAKRSGTFCSSKLKQGFSKFLIYSGLVLVACCVDFIFAFYATFNDALPEIICKIFKSYAVVKCFKLFIIFVEITSILENAKELGVDIPNWFIKMISKIYSFLTNTEYKEVTDEELKEEPKSEILSVEELQELLNQSTEKSGDI